MAGMQQPFGACRITGRRGTVRSAGHHRHSCRSPSSAAVAFTVTQWRFPRSHRSLCLARDLTVMSPGQRMSTGYRSVSSAGRAPIRGCRDPRSQSAMGLIGTAVSGVFLVAIGLVNFLVLARIAAVVHRMRKGLNDEAELEAQRDRRALLNRLLRPVKKTVRKPRHMYPVGAAAGHQPPRPEPRRLR